MTAVSSLRKRSRKCVVEARDKPYSVFLLDPYLLFAPAPVYAAIYAGPKVPHAKPLGTLDSWRELEKHIKIGLF